MHIQRKAGFHYSAFRISGAFNSIFESKKRILSGLTSISYEN